MTREERTILEALEGPGGYMTTQLAEKVKPVFGHSRHQHAARVRQILVGLQSRRLVASMGAEKPVVWVRSDRVPSPFAGLMR